jgi:2-C-methyl-D-erythritol 2,4-cyclodiphosphate synthase
MNFRIGYGYDVHRYKKGRPLILGGIKIDFELGLDGHSDADVLTHTIMDALLGALALGDIGQHFPDTNPAYKDVNSIKLLHHVYALIKNKGYVIGNIDSVIVAQEPKLKPVVTSIRQNLATELNIELSQISVKATTTEKLGPEGRLEGVSSHATVLLVKK